MGILVSLEPGKNHYTFNTCRIKTKPLLSYLTLPSPIGTLFYMFSFGLVASSLGVVCARNPVYSVLLLILAIFNTAGLFLLLGAEFLAMVLVVVYVGAVAVLFLFVVMMLTTKATPSTLGSIPSPFAPDRSTILLVGLCVTLILTELSFLGGYWQEIGLSKDLNHTSSAAQTFAQASRVTSTTLPNTEQLGMVIYTDYFWLFQLCGIILLVAMVGAILLVFHKQTPPKTPTNGKTSSHPKGLLEVEDEGPPHGAFSKHLASTNRVRGGQTPNLWENGSGALDTMDIPRTETRERSNDLGPHDPTSPNAPGKSSQESGQVTSMGPFMEPTEVPPSQTQNRKKPASLVLTQPPVGKGLVP